MYPIERSEYVNAYIAAISEEMKQARRNQQKAQGSPGAFDRFHRTVARILHKESTGPPRTMDPVPH
jgi:hypothetical protein